MTQQTLHGESVLANWYAGHESDYARVRERLRACRNVMLNGPIHRATDMMFKSLVNAIMSVRTDKDRHERAFTAWAAGDKSLSDAAAMTVYGNQKGEYLDELTVSTAREAVITLRESGHITALTYIVDTVTGLAHRKAAFSLAMVGVWELMCIDSNVNNFTDVDVPRRFWSSEDYVRTCADVRAEYPQLDDTLEPFLVQWAMYDYMRGEHARHMAFYREVLPV